MAMARASLLRSSLAWLHVLRQMYRMMASAGVIIPAPSGGTPGRHPHGCLSSPSGQRAEHEVARSWTERSRPRGHRPTGQEHERARQETSGRQPENWLSAGTSLCLRGTQHATLVRKIRRWYCVGSALKYVGAKQVVRGDPLRPGLVPLGSEVVHKQ